ncbi:MAG: DNA polymerase III subunit delta [Candidatus Aminicenantes bacterium]|nr:DNA polymerase III subunit delta [Candidatus Aminicenantes bacterium]
MRGINPLTVEVNKDQPAPCYFFYGEEEYLAELFLRRLERTLITPDAQGFNSERFDLAGMRWADIIDTARTAPFFFSPWRIVVVTSVENSRERKETRAHGDGSRKLSSMDEKILREYFHSPASRTVLMVVMTGQVKKTHPLVKLFLSLPKSKVQSGELKPLKPDALQDWMARRLAASGKSATPAALSRLEEIVGSNLRRIDQELEKIAVFTAERKMIDLDDVHEVCDWTRSFVEWDLTDALKKGDARQSLLTLKRAFQEGEKPENVLRILANFFRDLLLAALWLREGRDRKDIFSELKPQIKETFIKLYADEFRAFFSLVDSLSLEELNRVIRGLERIDLSIKTSDADAHGLIEMFLLEYFGRKNRAGKRRDTSWKGSD